ncbi:MAG: tetratricopeptide repeat protein [Burkholderiaceae bacterium]|nr:tetratricopeptide repeat protein [Burkholderiaceae bacterium]
MFAKTIATLLFAAGLITSAVAWAAAPSVDQVYQAARAGNYAQAQSMMTQALREHPDSAKAHFVEAELLARQGKLPAARGELAAAQKLNPNLSFAKPEAVQELQSLLSSGNGQMRQMSRAPMRQGGVPWGLILVLVLVVGLVMMFLRARNRGVSGSGSPLGMPLPGGSYGSGGGVMSPQAGGGMGSGILGSLATGAAVGAGMMAGEALMNKVLNGGVRDNIVSPNAQPIQNVDDSSNAYNMGGNDFGLNNSGAWDSGDSGDSWSDDGGSNDGWN